MDVVAREDSFAVVEGLWGSAERVFASRLTYVEAHAALAARARASVRVRRLVARARRDVDERWIDVTVVELDAYVAGVAALAAVRHGLRGADAVHFASAAVLGSSVLMVSRDERLRQAALTEGMNVAP